MGRIWRYLIYLLGLALLAFLVYAAIADLSITPAEREIDVPLSQDG
ncbi:MAG: hypothetical protein AAFR46_17440 [Pseudomonadota bacterium]